MSIFRIAAISLVMLLSLFTPTKIWAILLRSKNISTLFNQVQDCAIERVFRLLKGKFQRLKHMELEKLEMINQIIHAITSLHNFCIIQNVDNSSVNFEEHILWQSYKQWTNFDRCWCRCWRYLKIPGQHSQELFFLYYLNFLTLFVIFFKSPVICVDFYKNHGSSFV